MKNSRLLLLIYILIFSLILSLTCSLFLLQSWALEYNPEIHHEPGWLVRHVPIAFSQALPASAILSTFLIFIRVKRKPGNRILSFLLPFLTTFAVIVLGISVIGRFKPPTFTTESNPQHAFLSRSFHTVGSSLLYVEEVLYSQEYDTRLSQIVFSSINDEATNLVFEYYQDSYLKGNLELELPVNNIIAMEQQSAINGWSLRAPAFFRYALEEIAILNNYLISKYGKSLERLIFAALALAFCSMSCSIFSRISQWPLFNLLISLAMLRFIFFIFRLIDSDIFDELIQILPDEQIISDLPTILLAVLGAVFAICDFLFVPYHTDRKRVRNGPSNK